MRYSLLLVFLSSLIACQQNRSKIEKEIRSTIVNYYNDIRKEGLRAEFKYLDSSADFFWVPPGYSSYIKYDSVAAIIKRNASSLRSVDNSFSKLFIMPLTNKYAQFTMSSHSTIVDSSGKSFKIRFVETGIMIKRQDGWKFLSGQTSVLNE
jgi:penicillin V acylase-like amidase (Ntn superfamily)